MCSYKVFLLPKCTLSYKETIIHKKFFQNFKHKKLNCTIKYLNINNLSGLDAIKRKIDKVNILKADLTERMSKLQFYSAFSAQQYW